ncbi:MAG TPA: hypothetical protein EYP10_06870 [Armatimonadetes bacterium]|nr:hypothetical protein [Armatimonadota bacterium]
MSTLSWQTIAWHGVELQAPADWHIAHLRITPNESYMRMEDGDLTRLEIKWVTMPPGKAPDLQEQAKAYLAQMEKEAKKRKLTLRKRVDTKLISKRQAKGRNVLTFDWQLDYIGEGMLWWCSDCNKVLMAQVIGNRGERIRELARRIFTSISDHARNEWQRWSLFGLQFEMHQSMKLGEYDAKSGYVRFQFRYGDEESIEVARWSLANVILKRTSIEQWTADMLKEHLRRYAIDYRTVKIGSHSGIALQGRWKVPLKTVRLFFRQLSKRGALPRFQGWVWQCTDTNRILWVIAIVKPEHIEWANHVIKTVKCH